MAWLTGRKAGRKAMAVSFNRSKSKTVLWAMERVAASWVRVGQQRSGRRNPGVVMTNSPISFPLGWATGQNTLYKAPLCSQVIASFLL